MFDDHDLTQFVRDKDPEAFNRLVERHQAMTFGVALRVLHDRHLAEDAVQEAFFRLAREADQIRQSVGGWLHQAVYHVAIDQLRSDRTRQAREQCLAQSSPGEVPPDQPQQALENQEYLRLLDKALASLEPGDRDVLVLRYLEQLSANDLAKRWDISVEAVYKREQRALKRLRSKLPDHDQMEKKSPLVALLGLGGVEPSTELSKRLFSFGLGAGRPSPVIKIASWWWILATGASGLLLIIVIISLLPITKPNKVDFPLPSVPVFPKTITTTIPDFPPPSVSASLMIIKPTRANLPPPNISAFYLVRSDPGQRKQVPDTNETDSKNCTFHCLCYPRFCSPFRGSDPLATDSQGLFNLNATDCGPGQSKMLVWGMPLNQSGRYSYQINSVGITSLANGVLPETFSFGCLLTATDHPTESTTALNHLTKPLAEADNLLLGGQQFLDRAWQEQCIANMILDHHRVNVHLILHPSVGGETTVELILDGRAAVRWKTSQPIADSRLFVNVSGMAVQISEPRFESMIPTGQSPNGTHGMIP